MLYISGLLCIPTLPPLFFFCISWALAGMPRVAKFFTSKIVTGLRDTLLAMAAIFWISWFSFLSGYPHIAEYMIVSVILAFFVPFVLQLQPVKRSWIPVIIFAAVLILVWHLISFDDVRLFRTYSVNLNLLFGAILRVALGHTILVDATSQYGVLYPYVAAACLKPFGITIWSLSQWFAAFILAWYVFVGLAVGKRTGYNTWGFVVFILGLVSASLPICCGFNFATGRFWGVQDMLTTTIGYHQYFPIRTFWCGVFFWWMFQCNGKRRLIWLALGYVLAGVAFLWNMDSGLVLLVTWSGTWAMNCLADRSRGWVRSLGGMALHAVLGVTTAVVSVGAYVFFAKYRSGVWPNLEEMTQFQRVFYELGFYMLPMRLQEIWQPIILIYAVTVAWCVRKALQGRWDEEVRWLFFVAIYSLGAFSYYQGRSAISNLAMMFFPSLIISYYCAARMMSSLRGLDFMEILNRPQLRWTFLQVMGFSIVVMFCFLSMARQLPADVNLAFQMHFPKPADEMREGFADLRADLQGRKIIALGYKDAFICLETGAVSLLPLSSSEEVFLKEQVSKIQKAVDDPEVEYVVLDLENTARWPSELNLQAYPYYRDVHFKPFSLRLCAKRLPDYLPERWNRVSP